MKKRTGLTIIFLLMLVFIWGNSMMSQTTSSQESGFVMKILTPVIEVFVGKGMVTDHLVRKIAHFIEFAALGIVLGNIPRKKTGKLYSEMAGLGFAVAFIDETIQIFSARGPMIQDVWLDFAGVCFGILIMIIIRAIAR